LTGDRCTEVASYYKIFNPHTIMVVTVEKWSLFGGGR